MIELKLNCLEWVQFWKLDVEMNKKSIKGPFMGEIELTKLGETSKHMMGESRIDTIYTDDKENIWVDTWATTGGDPIPMTFLRKDLVDLIIELNQNKDEA